MERTLEQNDTVDLGAVSEQTRGSTAVIPEQGGLTKRPMGIESDD